MTVLTVPVEPVVPVAASPLALPLPAPALPAPALPAAALPAPPAPRARRTWVRVCSYDRLLPERGACALVGDEQVAVFRLHDGRVFAVANFDPVGRAHVMSRGIVGSRGATPTVASPLFKQVYALDTGRCLDDPAVGLPVWRVRVRDGEVEVSGAVSPEGTA